MLNLPVVWQYPHDTTTALVETVATYDSDSKWPWAYCIGTGGTSSIQYYLAPGPGYRPFQMADSIKSSPVDLSRPYVALMREIKATFGRTFSRLPSVLGVSRQTLYNWLDGEVPKSPNQQRIIELSQAASVFRQHRYTPTALDLARTLDDGKSFLGLIAAGADGQVSAERLVRLLQRGFTARARLNRVLAGDKQRAVEPSDFGAPAADES